MGCCTTELSYRLVLPEGKRSYHSLRQVGLLDIPPVVGRSLEHHTGDRTNCLLGSTPNLEGKHPEGSGPPTYLPLPLTSREVFVTRRLFRVASCRKGNLHLQTYMSSAGFEPLPYCTAVNVAKH
ncbi:hypothetical protein TNCV_3932361 [Trichonephila clavipes]|nr:hypothetical protein TNCV_3932361 [Trichonephila clavipes]